MRAFVGLGLVAIVVGAVLCVPLPYYVSATFEVQPRVAASVYVEVPGELKAVRFRSGTIQAGEVIAELADPEIRLSMQRLLSQQSDLTTRIESIRQRAHTDEAALLELSHTQETLTALNKQIARLEEDVRKLSVRAPVGGIVVPPPSRPLPERTRLQLAGWSGRPLDVRNVGAYLEASTLVCKIAQPGKLEAILAVDQEELDFVRSGQPVDLFLASRPGIKLPGRIDHLAEQNMEAASARIAAAAGGQLATRTDAKGVERPLSVVYQANVPIDDSSGQIVVGATGQARIHTGYQPVWQRLWRTGCRTFQFEM